MKTIIKFKINMYFNELKINSVARRLNLIRLIIYIILLFSLLPVLTNSYKSIPNDQIDVLISLLPMCIVLFLSCMLMMKPDLRLLKNEDIYNIATQSISNTKVALYICFTTLFTTLKVALISMAPLFFFIDKIKTWPTTTLLNILLVNVLIYFIFSMLVQTLALMSMKDKKKELFKILSLLSLLILIGLTIFLKDQEAINANILMKFFNDGKFYYIPIIGWGKAVIWGSDVSYIYLGCFLLIILLQIVIFAKTFSSSKLSIKKTHETSNSELFLNQLDKVRLKGNYNIVKKNLLVDARMGEILNFNYYTVGLIVLIIIKIFNLPIMLIGVYLVYIYISKMTSGNFNEDFKNIYIFMTKKNIRNNLSFIILPFYLINVLKVSIILLIGSWFLNSSSIYLFGQLISYFAIILLVHTFVKINFSDINGKYNNSVLFMVYIIIGVLQYFIRTIADHLLHLPSQVEFNLVFPFIEILFLIVLIKFYRNKNNSLY